MPASLEGLRHLSSREYHADPLTHSTTCISAARRSIPPERIQCCIVINDQPDSSSTYCTPGRRWYRQPLVSFNGAGTKQGATCASARTEGRYLTASLTLLTLRLISRASSRLIASTAELRPLKLFNHRQAAASGSSITYRAGVARWRVRALLGADGWFFAPAKFARVVHRLGHPSASGCGAGLSPASTHYDQQIRERHLQRLLPGAPGV